MFLELTEEITALGENLAGEYNAKDLHGLRTRMRRIRSLLKQLTDLKAEHFRKTWGGFAALTNQARDWDVFLVTAADSLPEAEYREFSEMFTPLVLSSHEAVTEAMCSPQWRRHLTDWSHFLEHFELRGADGRKSPWSIQEAWSRARAAREAALAADDARTWHKFRIVIKNLRYIADACSADPSRNQQLIEEVIADCKILQAQLGLWHDAVVQLEMIEEHGSQVGEGGKRLLNSLAKILESNRQAHLAEIRETLAQQNLIFSGAAG